MPREEPFSPPFKKARILPESTEINVKVRLMKNIESDSLNLEARIPLDQIIRLSALFHTIFCSGGENIANRETRDKELELGSEPFFQQGLPEKPAIAFLDFLKGNECLISEENAVWLFQLSQVYQLKGLQERIVSSIESGSLLDEEVLLALFDFALLNQSEASGVLLLHFLASRTCLKTLLERNVGERVKTLLATVNSCMKLGIVFSKMEEKGIHLYLPRKSLSKKGLKLLQIIKELSLPIKGLKIPFRSANDELLDTLSEILPGIENLTVRGSTITKLPDRWSGHLKVLDCKESKNLRALSLPRAKSVDCSQCPSLYELSLPLAEFVRCVECYALPSLTLSEAKEVDCRWCNNLTSLLLPKAVRIDCRGARLLRSITAPNAETVYCAFCIELSDLQLPLAKVVNCFFCVSLVSLTTSDDCIVDTRGCMLLPNHQMEPLF